MNTEKIYVIPKAGARVVDPATKLALPAEGKEVERSTYWLRRVREGDVTEGKAPAKSKTKE